MHRPVGHLEQFVRDLGIWILRLYRAISSVLLLVFKLRTDFCHFTLWLSLLCE